MKIIIGFLLAVHLISASISKDWNHVTMASLSDGYSESPVFVSSEPHKAEPSHSQKQKKLSMVSTSEKKVKSPNDNDIEKITDLIKDLDTKLSGDTPSLDNKGDDNQKIKSVWKEVKALIKEGKPKDDESVVSKINELKSLVLILSNSS